MKIEIEIKADGKSLGKTTINLDVPKEEVVSPLTAKYIEECHKDDYDSDWNIAKSCATCKYSGFESDEMPCALCGENWLKWEKGCIY